MARRATYIKDHSSNREHILNLDCGDFIAGSGEINELKAKYLIQGLSILKYDAINLGERDFLLGTKFLLEMKQKYKLPLISANVFYPDSVTQFTESYIIKKFKGGKFGDVKINDLKVGIFGILMERNPLVYKNYGEQLIAKNPYPIAKEIVKELKGKCDIIIALAHMTSAQINDLATNVKGINVIIGGHDFSHRSTQIEVNNVVIVQPGSKGQYIADLRINLDRDNKVLSYDGNTVQLDSNINDDPAFNNLKSDFDEEYGKLLKKRSQPQ